ncbi:MAG: hypothetical protein KatS3mg061_2494 [Dehalococcoidia bacterium]|nr:MAG: hypothetical protein KatS3mg061_2494 [Dehalococcoidia bacterium]
MLTRRELSRRTFLQITGLTALGGVAAACAPSPASPTASSAPAPTGGAALGAFEITVTQWPSLLYGPPYMIALEKGFFKELGLEVKNVVPSAGGGTTVRNIVTGGVPFGEVATTAAVQAFDAGAPLVIVGNGARNVNEIFWVTVPETGIKRIEDLRGKIVTFTNPGSVTEGVLNLCLKRAGIDPAQVDRRAAGGVREGLAALKAGGAQAAAHLQPIYAADLRRGEKFETVFAAATYLTSFAQTVLVCGPQLIKENPNAVRAFIQARARAIQFIITNPQEAAEIYGRYANLPADVCLDAFKAVDPSKYYGVGFDRAGLDLVEENLQILGLYRAGQKVNWKELVRQDFLPENVPRVEL